MSGQKYADGEYEAEGFYGSKSIIVKVQLDDDCIADVTVTPNTLTIPRSLSLQKKFATAVPEVVVGKPIDEVRLDKLAGSSLTTKGFNDALDKIKTEAARQ
ncbi:hypothetical protein PV379_00405 [Streptomyces caniscabiei]|uniref:hypothetical protein n=1 Tax=Streptomyces caniscabiei TaxID=2746961 RepID=UPI0029B136BC|nr:hypothetical protein [Streptomyces caniscabiei]MDX2775817.1 hypothetical protein [Streptomyces caniscabiei]